MARTVDVGLLEEMPGWELISDGLRDTAAAKLTPEACLVWIAEPRLRRNGLIDEPLLRHRIKSPEDVLYGLLCQEGGNAYGRYNALLRRLVKFEHALDRAWSGGGVHPAALVRE